MHSHYIEAGLRGPELIAILTSENALATSAGTAADLAILALYRDKFRRNVEFYGRILMANPWIWPAEGSGKGN
jgi:hypothetical protein